MFSPARHSPITVTFLASMLVAACGGSPPPHAQTGGDGESSASSGSGEHGAGASSERARLCTDGTCIECGDGLCPQGFYCDETAAEGPACSWLPECAQTASCDCVTAILSDCSCTEPVGTAVVRCD